MDFDSIVKFLIDHVDTIIALATIVGTYLGWDVTKSRRAFREDKWLRAASYAFRAVEYAYQRAPDEYKGKLTKAEHALELAMEYMEAYGLSPSEKEKSLWQAVWAHQAKTEKVAGGPVDGSDSGNALGQSPGAGSSN